jgi:hypothetical protein
MAKKLLIAVFGLSIVYWLIFVSISGYSQHPLGLYTQLSLVLMPLIGGIVGLYHLNDWGGVKSILGRSVLSLSLGMIFWGIALGMWTYFSAIQIVLPYPSVADYVFVASAGFHIIGLTLLAKVIGVFYGLRELWGKLLGVLTGFIVASLSYYILIVIGHNNIFSTSTSLNQVFFDYAYNLASLINISVLGLSVVFSRKYLGGKFRKPILLLFTGFFAHFWAVFAFVYTIGNGTYFNGNIADVLFTIAVFLESLGLISLQIENK